jgi:hypothetical protein
MLSRFLAFGLSLLLVGEARGQEYWLVSTRACPQVLGSEPFLHAYQLDSRGCMSERDIAEIQAAAIARPVIFLIHGSYFTADIAIAEGIRIRGDLVAGGAVTGDAIVVEFDWPSEMRYANLYRDANDKARRAFVAGYHLARFLQGFPPGSRISLIGHSHGGLVTLSALHLLVGGNLDNGYEATQLRGIGPFLRIRAVVIASASDRQWLLSGKRLGRSLEACEALLCLYNPLDPILVVHPLGRYSEGKRALGKCGMDVAELERLGGLAGRYCQQNIGMVLGPRHTFHGTTANPRIVPWIAAYTWAGEG